MRRSAGHDGASTSTLAPIAHSAVNMSDGNGGRSVPSTWRTTSIVLPARLATSRTIRPAVRCAM